MTDAERTAFGKLAHALHMLMNDYVVIAKNRDAPFHQAALGKADDALQEYERFIVDEAAVKKPIKGQWPAFPNAGQDGPNSFVTDGMSLRDWFAGQACLALSSSIIFADGRVQPHMLIIASAAYDFADAMLAARDKTS